METRITKIMEHYGLSSSQFADRIGVQRSSISHILSGRNKPSFDFMHKILTIFYEINANWLLLGEGLMLKSILPEKQNVIEQDLFAQNIDMTLNKPIAIKEKQIVNTKENPDEKIKSSTQNTEILLKKEEFTNVNNVKQVILIYGNSTFEIIDKR